ncbi:peptidoglycan-binding protein [Ramlibacter sp.]|uniref:CIS tube protein n=1 Tax=Ramlibacter sp. TaxID=1917967 RepID=UPI0025F321EA|nr:peptidoglycan-binding protein [Ramlibacter sp.]
MATAPAFGQKTLLTLTRVYVRPEGTVQIDSGVTFTAMVNPAEISHDHSIRYNTRRTLGQVGSDAKFSAMNPDKLKFSMVLDGTGVVPPATPSANGASTPPPDVQTLLTQLYQVVYSYVSTKHEPGHVRVLWGTIIFFGRLDSLSVRYTLFKPSGAPLRARVEMGFIGTMSKSEGELISNKSSPDLSHSVLVKEGDTLPLLCDRIYSDSSYYPDVARFNGLADFRSLKPGQRLHFPPLG